MGHSSGPNAVNSLTLRQTRVSRKLGDYLLSKVGTPAEAYTGDIVAPLEGEDKIRSLLASYDPGQFDTGQTAAVNAALSGKPSYNLDPETMRNYFNDTVAAPALRTYDRDILPRLRSAYAGKGASFSSRRGIAEGQALGDLNQNFAAELARAMQANQGLQAQLAESAANRQISGVALAEALGQAPLDRANALTAAMSPLQQHAQLNANAQYQEFQRTSAESSPWNALALQYLGLSNQALYQKPGGLDVGTSAALGAGSGALSGFAVGGPIGALIGGVGGGVSGAAGGSGGTAGASLADLFAKGKTG